MDSTVSLQRMDQAVRLLAEARSLDDILHIRDLAEAARTYAQAAKLGLAAQNHATEIKIRAERKAGEILGTMEKARGSVSQLAGRDSSGGHIVLPPENNAPTLNELGIEKMQAHRWQTIASVPDEVFERHVAQTISGEKELTSQDVYRLGRKLKQSEQQAERRATPLPIGTYHVIYADPAWAYDNSGFEQSAASHYPTMTTEAICALPVADLCTPDTVLFLWATSPLLDQAFLVIEAWGFTYKAGMVWDKGKAPGIGWFVSTEHEHLLIATRDGNPHPATRPRSIIREAPGRHSAKPMQVYDLIESMYPGPYCELFARNARPGWEAWGNEV